TVTVTILVTPTAAAAPAVLNTVDVSSRSTTDLQTLNNVGSVSTPVNPAADVSVALSASPSSVEVGQNLTYTLDIVTHGPTAAALFSARLPAKVTCRLASSSQGTTPLFGGILTAMLGTMTSGSTARVTIVVTPQTGAIPSVRDQVTIASKTPDLDTSNNMRTL